MKALLISLSIFYCATLSAQQTYVPDDNFETYLEANGMGNGIANDDSVSTINISGVTSLSISNLSIMDMEGIQGFVALDGLISHNNPFTSIDLTQNTSLTLFASSGSQLTSLDVSQNTALTTLMCDNNQLTSLDVSQNIALMTLYCNGNQLTSLDVSGVTTLINFECANNQLTSLDVSQNPNLNTLHCFDNPLTFLDVSGATALTTLWFWNTTLTSVDLSQNAALDNLTCPDNQLTSLDVSQVFSLTYLDATNNQLECLNANNGQNYYLECEDNSSLTCISVNDPVWFNNNAISDPWATFTYYCQPDLLDNDVNKFGTELTAEQNNATYQWLDCDNNYSVINGETNQAFTALSSGNYAVEISFQNCFGLSVDTSTCVNVSFLGMEELLNSNKELVKIVDLMGRETNYRPNTPLIYIYSDGTTKKVFKLEDL